MANSNGALVFDAVLNDSNFHSTVEGMKKDIKGVSGTANVEANKIASSFTKIGAAVGIAFTGAMAINFAKSVTRVRSEIQQLEIAFSTMLGSKAKSDALMSDIVDFASTTPFDLRQVATGAKQLLAYGFAAETVKDNLTVLGNVASGVGSQVGDLVYLYGTLKASGRVTQMDINQFAGRGIPIYEELAKVLNVNVESIRDLVSAGTIGFADIEKAFKGMTDEGGMFFELMQEQSKSLGGQISNLGDNFDQMLNSIGKSSEGFIGGGIEGVAYLVENYETIGKLIGALVVTYGAYKAAVIAVNTVEKVNLALKARIIASNGVFTSSMVIQEAMMMRVAKANAALNASMLANPYVLLTTVIVGLAAAVWLLHDSTTAEEKSRESVNAKLKENIELIKELKNETESLESVINSETESQYEKVKAFEKLKQMYPELLRNKTLESHLTETSTERQKQFNNELAKTSFTNTINNLNEAEKALKSYNEELTFLITNQGNKNDNSVAIKKQVELIKEAELNVQKYKIEVDKAKKADWEANTPIEEKIKYYNQAIESVKNQISELKKVENSAKNIAGGFSSIQSTIDNISLNSLNSQLQTLENSLNAITGSGKLGLMNANDYEAAQKKAYDDYRNLPTELLNTDEGKAIKKAYEDATLALEKYNLTSKKVSSSNTKAQVERTFPAGSVAEYTRLINKAQESLERLNATSNPEKVTSLKSEIERLTKERAEAEKAIALTTFQDEIEEKKNEYLKYELWATTISKEVADLQFKDLLKNGKSFTEYLHRILAPIDFKVTSGQGTEEEAENVTFLVKLINEANNAKTAVEKFNEELDVLRDNSSSLTNYLSNLEEKRQAILSDDNLTRSVKISRSIEIDNRINEAKEEGKAMLASFLEQVRFAETDRLRIETYYADLRFQVEDSNANNKIELINKINEEEKKALDDSLAHQIRNSESYLKLSDEILGTEREQLLNHFELLKKAREEALNLSGGDTNNQEYIKLSNDVKRQAELISNFDTQKWKEWASIVGNVGDVFSDMEGTLGNIGKLLAGISDASQNMYISFKKTGEALTDQQKADSIQSGVNSLISLLSTIAKSSSNRREARQAAEDNSIKQQEDYNKVLLERIRLESILAENPYVKDYAGRISDAMDSMQSSTAKALETLSELIEKGKARNGNKNKVDWDAVGKTTGAGAGVGATIGTAVGGWAFGLGTAVGAAIGAIGGALTGLLTAYKVDARFSSLFDIYPELIAQNGELNEELAQTLIANEQLDEWTEKTLKSLIETNKEWKEAKNQILDIVSELSGQLGNDLRTALVDAFESGTDAASAFSGAVEKVLNDMLSKLIFSTVFKSVFDALESDLSDSLAIFGASGGTDISGLMDSFGKFSEDAKEATDLYMQLLEMAKQRGKELDLDLFNNGKESSNSMQGAIKGVTEETASILAGQINAIRINQANNTIIMNSQLTKLTIVADNSLYLPYLLSIDKRLASLSGDQWRAGGFTQ